ncbi:MAG: cupin domain-containing protein [Fimbriimonadaceae bacterium]
MIGKRLRELRLQNGQSLRALAARVGVSATLISQIERDQTEPSLSTLRAFSRVFGESVASLFSEPNPPSVWVSRPGERMRLVNPKGGVTYEKLVRGNSQLEVLRAVFAPGQFSAEYPTSHASVECAYVVQGEITLEVAGTAYVIGQGESVTFEAAQPHRYVNLGSADTEVILSITPPIP